MGGPIILNYRNVSWNFACIAFLQNWENLKHTWLLSQLCLLGTSMAHCDRCDFARGLSLIYQWWPRLRVQVAEPQGVASPSLLCQSSPLNNPWAHLLCGLRGLQGCKGPWELFSPTPPLKVMQNKCQKRKIHPDGCLVTKSDYFHMQNLYSMNLSVCECGERGGLIFFFFSLSLGTV